MRKTISRALLAFGVVLTTAHAASTAANVTCTMTFNLSGWSFFYQTASGRGRGP